MTMTMVAIPFMSFRLFQNGMGLNTYLHYFKPEISCLVNSINSHKHANIINNHHDHTNIDSSHQF